ncbi:hypothetical protein PENSPDRAFT_751157 [Peniophora sp. CONT]|nr:hypothetical protein PENSPDRAFT_751157 [Peniophora sp. CONT]
MSSSFPSFLSYEHDTPTTTFWHSRYCFLLSRGYELPVSLAPAAGDDLLKPATRLELVDATRVRDGFPVCIRRTTPGAARAHAHAATGARPAWEHLYNHIAPVLDVFSSEDGTSNASCVYVVMPRLVTPLSHIQTVADVAEFVQQALAALDTLHEEPVRMALGGCSIDDFGVSCEPDLESQVNVRYCVTNFAHAVRFGDDTGSSPSIDRRAAYAADVAAFGLMLKTEFTKRFTNLSFLDSLIIATDPKNDEPVWRLWSFWRQRRRESFLHVLLPQIRLHRLRGRDEAPVLRYTRDVRHVLPLAWQDPRVIFILICGHYVWRAMGLHVEPSTRAFVDLISVIWCLAAPGASWWVSRQRY